MIAVIDYGMGNLRSVQKAFEKVGAHSVITQDPEEIESAQKIVLPGVGASKPAMERLQELKLIPVIKAAISEHKPFLGICLGLQLLFEKSFEGGEIKGLNILPGIVDRFKQLKVPHMGWNQLQLTQKNCPLFKDIKNLSEVYFCHSFYVKPALQKITAATTEYGGEFTSAIWQNQIFGVQFHPEKSQSVGLQILQNFNALSL